MKKVNIYLWAAKTLIGQNRRKQHSLSTGSSDDNIAKYCSIYSQAYESQAGISPSVIVINMKAFRPGLRHSNEGVEAEGTRALGVCRF